LTKERFFSIPRDYSMSMLTYEGSRVTSGLDLQTTPAGGNRARFWKSSPDYHR
jgi:hypothetical protein